MYLLRGRERRGGGGERKGDRRRRGRKREKLPHSLVYFLNAPVVRTVPGPKLGAGTQSRSPGLESSPLPPTICTGWKLES